MLRKRKALALLVCLLMALQLLPATAFAETAPNNIVAPDLTIENAQQLKDFAIAVSSGDDFAGKLVQLTANIDLTSETWTTIAVAFKGTFDGNYKYIKNIEKTLFNTIDTVGTVKNLGMIGTDGHSIASATIAETNNGTIENCYNTMTINSNDGGGIVHINNGTIQYCFNAGSLPGSNWLGGIAGDNNKSILNCYNTGSVSSSGWSGGIAGRSQSDTDPIIQHCYNIGTISGARTGSLIGRIDYGTIKDSYSNGEPLCVRGTVGENVSFKSDDEMKSAAFLTLLNGEQASSPWVADTNFINNGYPVFSWQKLVPKLPSEAPILDAAYDVTIGDAVDITFADNMLWRNSITEIFIGNSDDPVADNMYTISAGEITFNSALFTEAKDYVITIKAIGYKDATVTQTVKPIIYATGVMFDKSTEIMIPNSTLTLKATFIPNNTTNQAVSWESSDTTVAAVYDDGVVNALALGSTDITVTTQDGSYTATCNIIVSEPQTVSVTLPADGATLEAAITAKYPSMGTNVISDLTIITSGDTVMGPNDFTFIRNNLPNLTKIDLSNATVANSSGVQNVLPESAFAYTCKNLEEVVLNDNITKIENYAFRDCRALERINFPSELVSIGNWGFASCYSLEAINLPSKVRELGNEVFATCVSAEQLTLPEGLTSLPRWAFHRCGNIKEVTIPQSMVTIGEKAFAWCDSLATVTFAESSNLTTIKEAAFEECSSLTDIEFPDSVTNLGIAVLARTSVQTFDFNRQLPKLDEVPAGMFAGCKELTSVILRDDMTAVRYGAFGGCEKLKTITLPERITELPTSLFFGCYALEEVLLEAPCVKLTGNWVFVDCKNLKKIPAQIDITNLELYKQTSPFAGCSNLELDTLPEGMINIPLWTFYGCPKITIQSIPSTVEEIGARAFWYCTQIGDNGVLTVEAPTPPTMPEARHNPFIGTNITTIAVPASCISAYKDAEIWNTFNIIAISPKLTAGASIKAGEAAEITFTDDAAWRGEISRITINGNAIDTTKYTVAEGKITLDGSLFAQAKDYEIVIKATGYKDTAVTQTVTKKSGSGSGSNSGGATTPTAVNSTTGKATVTPSSGGTISQGSSAKVVIPANALNGTASVTVTVQQVTSPPAVPAGFKVAGEVYEFSVGGKTTYNFAKNVSLTFKFDPSQIGADEAPAIYYYDESQAKWVNLGGTVSGATITVQVDHFTKYAVLAVKKTEAALTDIAGHWAQSNIEKLVELGAVSGYPDGNFKPDTTITRAEFATILVKAFKLTPQSGKVFADTTGHWAKDNIATAASYGIVNGYEDGSFGPDDLITREQMAVMVVKAAKLDLTAEETSFADSASISEWANSAIATAVKNGIMKGYTDNTVQPQGSATRAEAVTIIVNALNR